MRPEETDQVNLPYAPFGEVLTANLIPRVNLTFSYNINPDLVKSTVAGSGAITQGNSLAIVNTTAALNSSALLESIEPIRYITGIGCIARFTALFTPGKAGSVQEIGIGDGNDALVFGYNGASFGINRRQNGVNNWVEQGAFNVDTLDGNGPSKIILDQTLGNIYQISYQWLGFGEIWFSVEYPAIGKFIRIHRIKYANQNSVPSIFNPTLPMRVYAANTTNNTAISVKTASFGAFITADDKDRGLYHAVDNAKTGITTETNIITIRNNALFSSKTNRVPIHIVNLSLSTDGTKIVKFRLIKNATLGGSPSYTALNANTSVISSDVAGTTVSGGTLVTSLQMGKADSRFFDLSNLQIKVYPGETLTVSAQSTSSTDVGVTVGFEELF